MRTAEPIRAGAAVWDIAVPSRPRLAGVSMAGFRDLADDLVDMAVIPHPAVTLVVDLGDGMLIEDGSGHQRQGNVVAGVGPGAVRGRGRHIECLQIRLSPLVARAAELSGSVTTLDDLWGRDAGRIQERLREARSWDDRFALAEAALVRRLDAGPAVDPEVAFAWRRMAADRGQGSAARSDSPPSAPPSSSASTTPRTASPPATAPPPSPWRAATPTSPTSTGTSWPSPA